MKEGTRYHINPDTGNTNICRADHKCRFNVGEERHFDSKEEARQSYEWDMEAAEEFPTDLEGQAEYIASLKKLAEGFERPGQEHHFARYFDYLSRTVSVEGRRLNDQEGENLYRLKKMMELPRDEEGLEKAKRILKQIHPNDKGGGRKYEWGHPRYMTDLLAGVAVSVRFQETKPQLSEFPERVRNTGVIGLDESVRTHIQRSNTEFQTNGNTVFGKDALAKTQEALNAEADGHEVKFFDTADPSIEVYYASTTEGMVHGLEQNNQLYLAAAFPDKELRVAMEDAGLNDVSVGTFHNSREWGNTYTVIDPNGNTRTFSVYEHRNTDSIIINGKTNWSPDVDGMNLPYASDTSKNEFFAEFPSDDRDRAAQTLTFFMKSAQKGELESDDELVRKAPKRDWVDILSKSIPGYKEWHEKTDPAGAEMRRRREASGDNGVFDQEM